MLDGMHVAISYKAVIAKFAKRLDSNMMVGLSGDGLRRQEAMGALEELKSKGVGLLKADNGKGYSELLNDESALKGELTVDCT